MEHRWSGDVKYADFYERALMNGIMGVSRLTADEVWGCVCVCDCVCVWLCVCGCVSLFHLYVYLYSICILICIPSVSVVHNLQPYTLSTSSSRIGKASGPVHSKSHYLPLN